MLTAPLVQPCRGHHPCSSALLGRRFGVTHFLSLGFRLVSTVQATMATVSGIMVVLNCKDVVYDR